VIRRGRDLATMRDGVAGLSEEEPGRAWTGSARAVDERVRAGHPE